MNYFPLIVCFNLDSFSSSKSIKGAYVVMVSTHQGPYFDPKLSQLGFSKAGLTGVIVTS